jgi:CheY-like chemotaxis protein
MAGKKILERLGYRVVTATGSSEALETFRSQPSDYGFDLVITDMTMPHMTGLELAGELNRIRPGVPIVMSTGYSEKITVEHAREHSFREILMKPLTVADLADAVRRALDE